MAAHTQAFSKLLAPGLRKTFFDTYKLFPEEYSKVAKINDSKRAYEEELMGAGLGRWQRKEEGKPLVYDEPIQGNVQRYTHVTFALGFRVTREMYNDDLYGVMKKMSQELARAARQTVELEFASLLDDAFTGSEHTGPDGNALCSSHTLAIGSTYSNVAGSPTDLGIGALRSASERMERTPNERGLPDNRGRGKTVLVSPTYQWVADEIIGSEKKAYTADNTKNAFNNLNLEYTVNHFMSDDDAWFLLASDQMHDIKWFWRQRPQFENEDDFDTKDAKFTGYMRFSYGWTDWRGVDGSAGAG